MSECVYVIKHPSGLNKIGVTGDPQARLSAIKTEEAEPDLTFAFVNTRRDGDARRIERIAHLSLGLERVRGEWFSVQTEQAVDAVKDAIAQMERRQTKDAQQPWAIKSISYSARTEVIRAARREGITVGQWLERHITEWAKKGPDRPTLSPSEVASLSMAVAELSKLPKSEIVDLALGRVRAALIEPGTAGGDT